MDHYAALGLEPGASITEIRTQFRRLAMVFHPDRNNDDAWCREQLMRLNASYEFLLNAAREGEVVDSSNAARGNSGKIAVSARRGGAGKVMMRETARDLAVAPPSPAQRIMLSALFCAALLGAVAVIGALFGEGQPVSDPAPTAVANSYYPPNVSAGPGYAPTVPSSAIGQRGEYRNWPASESASSGAGVLGASSSQRPWISSPEPVDYAPADHASAKGVWP